MDFDELSLLYGEDYKINDRLSIHHPTLGEIREIGEERYDKLVSAFTATPSDCMAILDGEGIDYEKIDDFSVFAMMSKAIDPDASHLIVPGINLSELRYKQSPPSLVDQNESVIFDPVIYEIAASFVRKINGRKKNDVIAGNAATKRYLIEEAREKAKRPRKPNERSSIAPLVLKLTNSCDFKYDIFSVQSIPIYLLMESVAEIQHGIRSNQVVQGVYAGNLDSTKISKKDMAWFRL